jgi:hypothetical protein
MSDYAGFAFLLGAITATLAYCKGRSMLLGFVLGLLLGPIGFLVMVVLQPTRVGIPVAPPPHDAARTRS